MKYTDYYSHLNEAVVPEQLQIQYAQLGTAQRGEPEDLGTHPHKLLQGSLSYPLEHIGDLVHRLSYNYNESKHFGTMQGGGGAEYGRDAALYKIEVALRYAQDFLKFGGMRKVVEDIAKNNYQYVISNDNYNNYDNWESEWKKLNEYLKKYAVAHRKLTPLCYSYYQKLGNKATIALGEMDQDTYINSLTQLQKILQKKTWKQHWYDPNPIK